MRGWLATVPAQGNVTLRDHHGNLWAKLQRLLTPEIISHGHSSFLNPARPA